MRCSHRNMIFGVTLMDWPNNGKQLDRVSGSNPDSFFFIIFGGESVNSKRVEMLTLLNACLKEMRENQTVLLKRGDKFQKDEQLLFGKMYMAFKEMAAELEVGEDVAEMIRHKNLNIFEPHESFFMDLFETHQFGKLFEFFEYE